MNKRIAFLFMLPVLWFMACKSTVTESEPQVYTITIGFTASETGNYTLLSARQVNGLKLWMDWGSGWTGSMLQAGSN